MVPFPSKQNRINHLALLSRVLLLAWLWIHWLHSQNLLVNFFPGSCSPDLTFPSILVWRCLLLGACLPPATFCLGHACVSFLPAFYVGMGRACTSLRNSVLSSLCAHVYCDKHHCCLPICLVLLQPGTTGLDTCPSPPDSF